MKHKAPGIPEEKGSMRKVYIASACRTPIGKMGGMLAEISAVSLGAAVLREATARAGIAPQAVDHVYLQAGVGQNIARQASLKAGLPVTAPAQTVNVVCAGRGWMPPTIATWVSRPKMWPNGGI